MSRELSLNPLFICCSSLTGNNGGSRLANGGNLMMFASVMRRSRCLLVVLGLTLSAMVFAVDRHDHEQAREALAAGEILPLKTVLETVERKAPGKVLAIELERHRGRWMSEIKLLRPGGALVKVWVDAADGVLIARRGANGRSGYCTEKEENACPDR